MLGLTTNRDRRQADPRDLRRALRCAWMRHRIHGHAQASTKLPTKLIADQCLLVVLSLPCIWTCLIIMSFLFASTYASAH